MNTRIYDVLAIRIGPFNLGLAALLQDHPEIDSIFLEQKQSFNWHPGLLLPWARLQVPFYADLVTGANPQSKFSYLKWLHATQKLFQFAVQENNFPLRIEYNEYCQWVAKQLPNLLFSHYVNDIVYDERTKIYIVNATHNSKLDQILFHAKHLVIGTGTRPHIPQCINHVAHPNLIHSGQYLFHRNKILAEGDITSIGSGQSAAEIFYDLLQHHTLIQKLNWFTRAAQIHPMDYSRFALEMSSRDYINYFNNLPEEVKEKVLATQHHLYKGVNQELIKAIHDQLSLHLASRVNLNPVVQTSVELKIINPKNGLQPQFAHISTKNQLFYKPSQ